MAYLQAACCPVVPVALKQQKYMLIILGDLSKRQVSSFMHVPEN